MQVGFKWVASATIIILILAIWQTLWLPVYPDEVANKIVLERFFLSGGLRQALIPQCADGFLIVPPIALLPASMFWAFFDHLGTGLVSFRLLPVLCFSVILIVLLYRQKDYVAWPILLLVTLGPILYGILIFRAEIFLLSASLLFYLIAIKNLGKIDSLKCVLLTVLMLFVLTVVLWVHPKALYLTPLALLCIIFGSIQFTSYRWKLMFLGVFVAVLLWIVHDALQMHLKLFASCDAVPSLKEFYGHQAVNILDLFYNKPRFYQTLSEAFSLKQLIKTAEQITYKQNFDIAFLPSVPAVGGLRFENILIIVSFYATLSYATVKIAIGCVLTVNQKTRLEFITLGVFFTIFLFIHLLNLNKSFYDCSLFVAALCVTAGLARPLRLTAGLPATALLQGAVAKSAAIFLIFTAALSLILNRQHFTSDFKNGYRGPSADILELQDLLALRLPDILKRHPIDGDQAIVIDDLTYDLFKQQPVVLPITYLMSSSPLISNVLAERHVHYGIFYCFYVEPVREFTKVSVLETITVTSKAPPVCLVSFKPFAD